MSKLKYVPIVTDIDKFNERVDEITSVTSYNQVLQAVSDIKHVLNSDKSYVALCGPQIGLPLRLFVVKTAKGKDLGDSRYKVFLNPMIVSSKGTHLSRETNLSLPDKQYIIPRSDEVHVAYQEVDGKVNSESFIGAYGEIVQQMIQMLDGITLADFALDLDDIGGPDAFDKASKKDKVELLTMYLDSMRSFYSYLSEEMENEKDLKDMNTAMKFIEGVLEGNITPIKPEDSKKE